MTDITDEMIAKGADAIADLLTMLGVDPDERIEHNDAPPVARQVAELALQGGLAGRTVVDQPGDEQWFVFYGGPDPDNSAGRDLRDDEIDATEHLQWVHDGHGAGVARRSVHYGPWEITQFKPGRAVASGTAGGGTQHAQPESGYWDPEPVPNEAVDEWQRQQRRGGAVSS